MSVKTIDDTRISYLLIAGARTQVIIRGVLVEHHSDGPEPYCQIYAYAIRRTGFDSESLTRLSYRTPLSWSPNQKPSAVNLALQCNKGVGSLDYLRLQMHEWDQFGHGGWIATQPVVFIREQRTPENGFQSEVLPVNHPDATRRLIMLEQRLIDVVQHNQPNEVEEISTVFLPRLIGLNSRRQKHLVQAGQFFQGW